jgi:two-component system chemotaxis response regulator CheB
VNETPVTLLIVDDSALYRQAIRNVLSDLLTVRIVGTAANGADALSRIEEFDPDILTLDVQMPDMDGIEVLREIGRRGLRSKAIMVSSLTSSGAQITTDALIEGAFDFVLKPSGGDSDENRRQLHDALEEKITAFIASRAMSSTSPGVQRVAPVSRGEGRRAAELKPAKCRAVIIGISTGGPPALKQLLPALPASLPVPVLVVQHMPPKYTKALAKRLNEASSLEVAEASNGMEARAGRVLVAPGGMQMRLVRRSNRLSTDILDDPPEHGCRPSVDYLLRSAINILDGEILCVIMTGMGRDGLEGCRLLKEHGGRVFAQHPHGCAVYGMPKAIIDDGIADRILPLGRIGPALAAYFG